MVLQHVQRPETPYAPLVDYLYTYRYSYKDKIVPQAIDVEGDFNWGVDTFNMIIDAINDIQAGVIVGANDPLNKFKLPTTDGANNLSWTFVENQHIADLAVTVSKIDPGSSPVGSVLCVTELQKLQFIPLTINTGNLIDDAVTTAKIAESAVTTANIATGAVTTANIATGAVTTAKIATGAVETANINNNAVTTAKLDSGVAAIGTVATVTAPGLVNYQPIPTKGKILQTKQFIHNEFDSVNSDYPSFGSFNKKFQLSITPVSSNSYIVLNISMNVMNKNNVFSYPATYVMALFRNNSLFNKFTGASSSTLPGGVGGLFGGTSTIAADLKQHSISLIDDTYANTNPITYEVKGSSINPNSMITLNGSYNVDGSGLFGAITVSTITAMEIEK